MTFSFHWSFKKECLQRHFSFETHIYALFCKGWKWEKFRIRKGQTCNRKALTSILAFIMRLTDICLLTYREMHLLDHHWRRLMIVRPSGSHCFLLMGIPSYNLHTAAPPPPPPPSHSPCYAFAMSGRNNYWPKSISSEELQREASFRFTDALKSKRDSVCAKIETRQHNDPRVASKWS